MTISDRNNELKKTYFTATVRGPQWHIYFNPSKRANWEKKKPSKRDKVWLISFISHSNFVLKGQGESLLRCCGSFSFQQLSNIVTPTENKLSYSFECQRQQNLEVPKLKVRHIFIFYWAHNQLYIRHPWIPMWRKSVTLYCEKCVILINTAKALKKNPDRKKKIQEHLAQLTKSVICYRIGINNNPVTSLKQIAMTSFPFSFSW